MERTLGIVSTPYHLIVFMFLKESILKDHIVDLVVTDKTASMAEAYANGNFDSFFHKVYFADAKLIANPYKSAIVTFFESIIYNPTTKAFLDKKLDRYDHVYFASPGMPDEIVKEIAKTLILKNRSVTFHRFEDGFASYTKPPVHVVSSQTGQHMYQKLLHYSVPEHEKELLMFEPYLAEKNVADTDFTLIRIERDDALIKRVITLMQKLLHFIPVNMDGKVLFLGQGTANGAGNVETYRSLIREIGEHVGFDDFVMKPHPRGVNDDFGDTFKVYKDSCPFELAIANGGFEDKILISYYSTACATGSILFGSRSKVIFLYPMAADSFNEKCDYENYFTKLTELYDTIYIAHDRKELWELLDS